MGLFGIATNSVQMLVLVAVLTVAVFAVLYFEKFRYEVEGIRIYRKDSKKSWTNLLLVLAAALLVKLIFAAAYEGHGTDMTCFSAWSDMIFKDGFWNFYHSDSFTDYPPGYMAMLWGIGALRSIFNLDVATGAGRCVIKLIPILFDLGAGTLLYKIAKRKFSEGSSPSATGRAAISVRPLYGGWCIYLFPVACLLSVHGRKAYFCVFCFCCRSSYQTADDYVCSAFDLDNY